MSGKYFYPQDRRGAGLKAKKGGNKEAVEVVGELFEQSLGSIQTFKNNVVPAYEQAQKRLARLYEACDCKEKKNLIASTLMRNGLAVSLALRQIDRGERYSPLDPNGSAKGATRRPKKGEPDHKRGYTGFSFDDCRLAAQNSCHMELSSTSKDNIYMYMEAIRDDAEDIFKGVKEMHLSELRVTFNEIEFGGTSVPINGNTTSPFGNIAPTIPKWSKAQFGLFFSDTSTSGMVFGPKQPGEDRRNRLVPPPGKGALNLLRNKVMKLAAPNVSGTSSSGLAREAKGRDEAKSDAFNDTKPRPRGNQKNGKDGKSGGGRLKGTKSSTSRPHAKKKKRKVILEDTDEESGSDEPADHVAEQSRKESTTKLKDATQQARKSTSSKSKGSEKVSEGTKHSRKGLSRSSSSETVSKRAKHGGNGLSQSSSSETVSKGAKHSGKGSSPSWDPLMKKEKINAGHLTTIAKSAPERSKSFRTLSLTEGCHILESVEPKVRSLEYPPVAMVECSQFMRTKLVERDANAFSTMRLGLIQFISIGESNSDKEVKPLTGSDGRAVILVMSGKVSSLQAGEWQVWSPETRLTTRKADALVFNYFPAEKFHYMTSQAFSGRFDIIHKGFKSTGLSITKRLKDSQAVCNLRPEYYIGFHHSHGARRSLDQALRLYLGIDKSVIPPGIDDDSLKGDTLVNSLGTVEKHIIRLRKRFSLMVVANLPSGLRVVYGEKQEAICTKGTCVLYLHDALIPTIAHYYHDIRHFALLRSFEEESLAPGGVPYKFLGYDKYLDPTSERSTPCEFRTQSKKKTINLTPLGLSEKRCGKSIPALMGMTEKEREAIPPLNSSAPYTVSPAHNTVAFHSMDDIERMQNMKRYVTDEHVQLIMSGVTNEAKEGTSVVILGPQQTRMMKSRDWRGLHSLVAKYHPSNGRKGDVLKMEFFFLAFSEKEHFYPAVIYNPGQCQHLFGGRSGVVFFDTLYCVEYHKVDYRTILAWLDREWKNSGNPGRYPRDNFKFASIKVKQQPDGFCCGIATGCNIFTAFRHRDELFTIESIAMNFPGLLDIPEFTHTLQSIRRLRTALGGVLQRLWLSVLSKDCESDDDDDDPVEVFLPYDSHFFNGWEREGYGQLLPLLEITSNKITESKAAGAKHPDPEKAESSDEESSDDDEVTLQDLARSKVRSAATESKPADPKAAGIKSKPITMPSEREPAAAKSPAAAGIKSKPTMPSEREPAAPKRPAPVRAKSSNEESPGDDKVTLQGLARNKRRTVKPAASKEQDDSAASEAKPAIKSPVKPAAPRGPTSESKVAEPEPTKCEQAAATNIKKQELTTDAKALTSRLDPTKVAAKRPAARVTYTKSPDEQDSGVKAQKKPKTQTRKMQAAPTNIKSPVKPAASKEQDDSTATKSEPAATEAAAIKSPVKPAASKEQDDSAASEAKPAIKSPVKPAAPRKQDVSAATESKPSKIQPKSSGERPSKIKSKKTSKSKSESLPPTNAPPKKMSESRSKSPVEKPPVPPKEAKSPDSRPPSSRRAAKATDTESPDEQDSDVKAQKKTKTRKTAAPELNTADSSKFQSQKLAVQPVGQPPPSYIEAMTQKKAKDGSNDKVTSDAASNESEVSDGAYRALSKTNPYPGVFFVPLLSEYSAVFHDTKSGHDYPVNSYKLACDAALAHDMAARLARSPPGGGKSILAQDMLDDLQWPEDQSATFTKPCHYHEARKSEMARRGGGDVSLTDVLEGMQGDLMKFFDKYRSGECYEVCSQDCIHTEKKPFYMQLRVGDKVSFHSKNPKEMRKEGRRKNHWGSFKNHIQAIVVEINPRDKLRTIKVSRKVWLPSNWRVSVAEEDMRPISEYDLIEGRLEFKSPPKIKSKSHEKGDPDGSLPSKENPESVTTRKSARVSLSPGLPVTDTVRKPKPPSSKKKRQEKGLEKSPETESEAESAVAHTSSVLKKQALSASKSQATGSAPVLPASKPVGKIGKYPTLEKLPSSKRKRQEEGPEKSPDVDFGAESSAPSETPPAAPSMPAQSQGQKVGRHRKRKQSQTLRNPPRSAPSEGTPESDIPKGARVSLSPEQKSQTRKSSRRANSTEQVPVDRGQPVKRKEHPTKSNEMESSTTHPPKKKSRQTRKGRAAKKNESEAQKPLGGSRKFFNKSAKIEPVGKNNRTCLADSIVSVLPHNLQEVVHNAITSISPSEGDTSIETANKALATFGMVLERDNGPYINRDGGPMFNLLQVHDCKLIIKFKLEDHEERFIHHFVGYDGMILHDRPHSVKVNNSSDRRYKDSCLEVFRRLLPKKDFKDIQITNVYRLANLPGGQALPEDVNDPMPKPSLVKEMDLLRVNELAVDSECCATATDGLQQITDKSDEGVATCVLEELVSVLQSSGHRSRHSPRSDGVEMQVTALQSPACPPVGKTVCLNPSMPGEKKKKKCSRSRVSGNQRKKNQRAKAERD